MSDRAEVSSFEAIDTFRGSLASFIDTAAAALASAEVEIARTLTWLETEQVPFWKSALRKCAEEVEEKKIAYREKALYKDATGARHSAIDERRALDRALRKQEEYQKRAAATRRHIIKLQRDIMMYKGMTQRLTSYVYGDLKEAVGELRRTLDTLDRYTHMAPEPVRRSAESRFQAMTGGEAAAESSAPEPDMAGDEIETLRARTPEPILRARAPRMTGTPPLPRVPPEAREAVLEHLGESIPGRYDLLTVQLPDRAEQAGGLDVYFERREPAGPSDTGWHLGWAGNTPAAAACVTITAGRLADAEPDLAPLLRLPIGSLILAREERVCQIVDPLGRTLWRKE